MGCKPRVALATITAAFVAVSTARAAQLHVQPIGIELTAPAAASKIELTDTGNTPIAAQVRLFRWTQKDGRDVLERTRDVVASPPLLRMAPKRKYVVRIVRLSKAPVVGEESYRLLVDEIPQAKPKHSGVVFALRYSIPVFIRQRGATPAKVSWTAMRHGGELVLKARNAGQVHERLSALRVVLPDGRTKVISKGLAGYVLGGAEKQFRVRARVRAGGKVVIRGQGIHGAFTATVRVR